MRTPRASAVKRSLRLLQGELVAARGGSGKRRIEAPFCLRVREDGHLGPYMVSPAHFFSGSDERGRELRARFRRLQLGQLRED